MRSNWYNSYRDYNDKSLFHYVTFNDTLGDVQLTVNGTDVERTAHCAIIDVQIKYIAVSETGHAKVPAGITPYELGALDNQQKPYSLGVRSNGSYYMLRDEPVLCFNLGKVDCVDVSRLTLTSLTLYGQTYGSSIVVLHLRSAGPNLGYHQQHRAAHDAEQRKTCRAIWTARATCSCAYRSRAAGTASWIRPRWPLRGR